MQNLNITNEIIIENIYHPPQIYIPPQIRYIVAVINSIITEEEMNNKALIFGGFDANGGSRYNYNNNLPIRYTGYSFSTKIDAINFANYIHNICDEVNVSNKSMLVGKTGIRDYDPNKHIFTLLKPFVSSFMEYDLR